MLNSYCGSPDQLCKAFFNPKRNRAAFRAARDRERDPPWLGLAASPQVGIFLFPLLYFPIEARRGEGYGRWDLKYGHVVAKNIGAIYTIYDTSSTRRTPGLRTCARHQDNDKIINCGPLPRDGSITRPWGIESKFSFRAQRKRTCAITPFARTPDTDSGLEYCPNTLYRWSGSLMDVLRSARIERNIRYLCVRTCPALLRDASEYRAAICIQGIVLRDAKMVYYKMLLLCSFITIAIRYNILYDTAFLSYFLSNSRFYTS